MKRVCKKSELYARPARRAATAWPGHVALAALVAAWIATHGCSPGQNSPGVDSNTNWLKTCESSADCTGAASCLCGLCTRSCEAAGDCAALGEGAQCAAATGELTGPRCESHGGSRPAAICAIACGATNECAQDLSCADGLCVRGDDPAALLDGAGPMSMFDAGSDASMFDAGSDASMSDAGSDASMSDATSDVEASLADCAPGPCANGGRCSTDGARCECPVGSSGTRCEQLAAVRQLVAGRRHNCALLAPSRIKCWGANDLGQLGLGDTAPRGDGPNELGAALPELDLGTTELVHAISAGGGHTCALLVGGDVRCWGDNAFGQLGRGDVAARGDQPGELGVALEAVPLGERARAVWAGGSHTCALLEAGGIACWGGNLVGQLGLGDTLSRGDAPGELGSALGRVDLGTGARVLGGVASAQASCAWLEGDRVKCWGGNGLGQLGQGDTAHRGDAPGELGNALPDIDLGPLSAPIRALASSGTFVCVQLADGVLRCWGFGGVGQLGVGDTLSRGDQPGEMGSALPDADLGEPVASLAAGGNHSCAILASGAVKCWGQNASGTLGLGDTQPRADTPDELGAGLPALMLPAGTPSAVAAGEFHSCVVLDQRDIYCWGQNTYGQLGRGNTEHFGDQASERAIVGPAVDL